MVRALSRLSILLLSMLMSLGRAHAEAGALLPIVSEAGVPEQDSLVAQQAVIAYFAQRSEAVPVAPPEESLRRAGAAFRNCGDSTCAQAFAQKLEVDFAVVVRLFAPDRRSGPGSLSVALVTQDGAAYSGNVEIGDAGVHAATTRAAQLAHERLVRGPGPWLKIDGPNGSRVRVDGRTLHAIPYMEKAEPGLHRILVESEAGSMLYDGTVTLPDDPAYYAQVKVENKAPPSAAASSPKAEVEKPGYWHGKRSKWNYIIGVPLTVAGLIYTAVGAVHYASRGNCVDSNCAVVKTVDGNSKAALGLGLAGVAVGAGAFLFAGVIREPERAPTGAMLQLGGKF
jgi:hypothetical protein